jgi:hypothetical protein
MYEEPQVIRGIVGFHRSWIGLQLHDPLSHRFTSLAIQLPYVKVKSATIYTEMVNLAKYVWLSKSEPCISPFLH